LKETASPQNDGKQTPFKGHPVFITQHATAAVWQSGTASEKASRYAKRN
jgi:hypothetical protein